MQTTSLGRRVAGTNEALRWLARPYEFLRERAQAEGDTFALDLGSHGSFVLFSHPRAIRDIFTADASLLHAGKGNRVLRAFLGSGSLLLLEGDAHLRDRKLMVPAFHTQRIVDHGRVIARVAEDAVSHWEPGAVVAVHDTMEEISIEVILRAVFGLDDDVRRDELKRALLLFLDDPKFNLALVGQLGDDALATHASWRAFEEAFRVIRGLVSAFIAERRRLGAADASILGMLLSARDAQGDALDDASLCDELLTLVVAGYETTAASLAWALYAVHREPAVLERLRREVAGATTAEAGARNDYVDAVCKESLRMNPVIPVVARQAQAPLTIDGREIPAGTTVAPCVYLTHHREDLYPEPDVFRPTRFLERSYTGYEYLPFGGGARRCIGMNLAMWEMKIVLATVVSRCTLELVDPERVRAVRRSVTVAPSGGPAMRVVSR